MARFQICPLRQTVAVLRHGECGCNLSSFSLRTKHRQHFPDNNKNSKTTPSSINNLSCQHPQDPGNTSVFWNHRQAPKARLISSHISASLCSALSLSVFHSASPELTITPAVRRDYPSRDLCGGREIEECDCRESAPSVTTGQRQLHLFRHVCFQLCPSLCDVSCLIVTLNLMVTKTSLSDNIKGRVWVIWAAKATARSG